MHTDQHSGRSPAKLPQALAVATAGLVSLLIVAVGCGGDSGGSSAWSGNGFSRPAATVTAEAIRQGSFAVEAQFVGVLEATSAADLFARTSGQIVEVSADSGDRVRAGQLLARIEPDEAEKAVEQARAALRIAEATLSQREANLEIARATAERTEALYDQDLVSQQDQDAARADLVGARAQLELAEAQIEQAKANLSAARLDLEKTRVIAPFDGYVGKRYLDLGDLASTNRPVFSVVDLSTIETTISITEKDASHITRGQPATVRTEAFPGRVFEGQVARIASVFDPDTNTTEAEVEVANPEALLKPGMFADVAVTYRTEPTALLVPSSAVIETETEQYVYMVERAPDGGSGAEGGGPRNAAAPGRAGGDPTGAGGSTGPSWIARRVPVRILGTGAETRSLTAVEVQLDDPTGVGAELVPGAKVIVLGHETLSDGAPVALTEGTGAASPRDFEGGEKRS
jgi:RND family efflux transporter MFP subunit